MALADVICNSTRRDLVVSIVDENGNPVNLTSGAVALQGRSKDLSGTTINAAGTLTDPANGVATFSNIGALVSQATLTSASIHSATFSMRVKYTDSTAKIDYTPIFQITWQQDPLQPL